ncbi:MAG: TetR/AcrR family transcriptional regulator [Mariprofundaceae bacterium]|nr:TetR/AcrR family transcriptional regulator [Mariprofundaceae bacterium]
MSTPCDCILDAADARFADYGFNKTTMAEIATNCGMSVGNLYRHFKNKEAIALASMQRSLQAKLDQGIGAAAKEDDALAALHAFLLTRLRIGHAHYAGTRHLFDMMSLINSKHRALLLDYEAQVIDALAAIIGRGIVQGCFADCDARQVAYDMHQAMLRYNNPVNLKYNELSLLEADLTRLLQLFHRGLAC